MNKEIEMFVSLCKEEYKYHQLGDSKNGNKKGKKIILIANKLKKENRSNELVDLLNHDHPQVRYRAAEKLLNVFPNESEKILEELSTLKGAQFGLIGFVSQITLQEWRKGNIKF